MNYTIEATTLFCKAVGIAVDSIRGMEAYNMIEEEARLEELSRMGRGKRRRALKTAARRMVDWYSNVEEYNTEDIVSFVASHRMACSWAVLAAKDEKCLI